MTSKSKVFIADLASISQYYGVPKEVELLSADIEDTFQSSKPGCICINESMFKAGLGLPSEFNISKALNRMGEDLGRSDPMDNPLNKEYRMLVSQDF
ncbi:hypothetical protein ACLOJK_021993 [Asimina triloba]